MYFLCILIPTHVYVYLRMTMCIYASVRISTLGYVYLRMCTCMYACVSVSAHVSKLGMFLSKLSGFDWGRMQRRTCLVVLQSNL